MSLGPTGLRVAGGLGGVVVCGAAGLAVAADTRPPAAPLRPPVSGAPAATASSSSGGLVIPSTPVCQRAGAGRGTQASGVGAAGAAAATPDATVRSLVQRVRSAPAAQRRSLLQQAASSLTSDERLQLAALLRRAAAAGSGTGSAVGGCRGQDAVPGDAGGSVSPDVVAGGAAVQAPVTFSAVS